MGSIGMPHDHGHDHQHHHGHGHGHGHHHAPASFGTAFAIGILLNGGFVAVEAAFGFLSGSMALIADAGHNLGDVLGLAIAWGAAVLSQRRPAGRFTYGFGSSSILAALLNAVLLLVAIGAISVEAIRRLIHPEPVPGLTMMIVAAVGILINGITALLFARGRKNDLNIRGAFLHMVADAAISAAVVVAGLVILSTGWEWLDPAVSLLIVLAIGIGTWGLLRDSVTMSLQAAPPGIEPEDVAALLRAEPGVAAIHDLHIWPMSTTETALTVHLLMPTGHPGDARLLAVSARLRERFGIGHATIQIETDAATLCALAPDEVV